MNKDALIHKLIEETGFERVKAHKILDSFNDIILKSLKKGEKIVLTGFGTFLVSQRIARKGRNPHTGETMTLKASRVPRFRPGKEFKRLLNY